MEETLQDKIQSVIAKTGMNYKELAKKLGVSIHNFYKWKGSSNPRNHKEYEKVIRALDDLLENATREFATEDPRARYVTQPKGGQPAKPLLVNIYLTEEEDAAVYADEKAIPGSIITIKGKPALVALRNESPVMGEVDGLITVTGDSMEPKFKSGSWIAIKKLKFARIINAGYYYYIIDKNEKGLLRKVRPAGESNSITLLSENEASYPTITRSLDDILAIFSVEAVVTKQSV
jgi:phage repressor protein C with HTH and peptisase S24 domain